MPDDPFPPPRDFSPFWWVVVFTLLAMVGCVLASCRRSPQTPPTKAAPSDHRVEDDCPGGVCTIPPRKAPK